MIHWASNDYSNDDSFLLPQKTPLPSPLSLPALAVLPLVFLTPQAAEPAG